MAKAKFTKGQEVSIIWSWDGNGSASIRHCVVESCGQKRLRLIDQESGKLIDQDFTPNCLGLYPRRPKLDEESEAMEIATRDAAAAREICERSISEESHPRRIQYYQQKLSEVHEPRVVYPYR